MRKTRKQYVKSGNFEASIGNTKIGEDTLIFNMGSATDCPSRKRGMCKVGEKCYALQPEKMYPKCKPYRDRQADYWLNTGWEEILADIHIALSRNGKRKIPIKYVRFNESGDFHSQECIEKLSNVAYHINKSFQYKIVFYGYSARKDLDFHNVSFLVKSSGYSNGNNGKTRVIPKGSTVNDIEVKLLHRFIEGGTAWFVCPSDCSECNLCKSDKGYNVAFIVH